MFVGLSGPASTGKTTILESIKEPLQAFAEKKGLNVMFREEQAREVFKAEFAEKYGDMDTLLARDPLRFQLRLSEVFLQDVFLARKKEDLVLSDRVGLDVLVYTNIHIMRGYRNLEYERQICANLKTTMLKVEKIFMTQPLGQVEQDGFRPGKYSEPLIRAHEENMFNVLGGTYPNTVWLPEGREDRISLIMSTITNHYN